MLHPYHLLLLKSTQLECAFAILLLCNSQRKDMCMEQQRRGPGDWGETSSTALPLLSHQHPFTTSA